MTLAWLWPWALTGALALLAPLLLHLDRRRSQRLLPFAALRWLAARQRPQRTWQLREWLLLVLRLLLIATLVAWLAQPLLHGVWRAPRHWLAVVPGASVPAGDVAGLRDAVWLAPGFPALDSGEITPSRSPSVSSLLREFDQRLAPADTLTVRVPQTLAGLDAAAIDLSRAVDWQVDAMPRAAAADTTVTPSERPLLALRHDGANTEALRPLRAAIAAWSSSDALAVTLDEATLDVDIPAQARAAIVLHAAPDARLDDAARRGTTLLVIDTSAADQNPPPIATDAWPPETTAIGRGRVLHLRTPLDPAHVPALHDASFARDLHTLLFAADPAPSRALAIDVAPTHGADAAQVPTTPLRPMLAWIAAVLFLLERIVASGRRLVQPA